MYDREINGKEYSFGVSGKLIRNVLVMYDRETGSYWSQLLGESVEGELIGTKLEFVPSWMTTWEQWKEMHPNTVALNKGFMRGSSDSYAGYYNAPNAGVIGETFQDDRLYTKEFVIGVEVGETAVAYPFSVLNDQPLINETVAGTPLVVIFDTDNGAGVIYDRRVDGQTLTFEATRNPLIFEDVETGSQWDGFNGVATDGPLAGQTLTRIKSTTVFWFGWKDFHPDTLLYGVE